MSKIDPSMLLAYLIRNEQDWKEWRHAVSTLGTTPILHIADTEPSFADDLPASDAVDDVEVLDEYQGSDDGEIIHIPTNSAK